MKKIKKIFIFTIIMIVFLQFPLFHRFWLTQVGGFLVYQDKIEPADAILVLGGGKPERVLQGVELYQRKYGDKMIFTGECDTAIYGPSHHWALQAEKLAESKEVPKRKIITILNSRSTHDDATLSKTVCDKHNFKSLIVISEPYHTKRAFYTFKKVYKNSGVKIMIYPAQHSWYKKNIWWQSEEGLMATNGEYVKFIYYLLKGFI